MLAGSRTGLLFGLTSALAAASCSRPSPPAPVLAPPSGLAFPMYHFDPARTGWSDAEHDLTPAAIARGLSRVWVSNQPDAAVVSYSDSAGTHTATYPARFFATPIYLDDVVLTNPPYAGVRESVVIAASTNDWVYALAAFDAPVDGGSPVRAGTVLWSTRVGSPVYVAPLDGGMPLGVLGTPVVDRTTSPPTLYVVAADAAAGWQVFALDVTSGAVRPGWPVPIDPAVVSSLDRNVPADAGPPAMELPATSSQRSSLLLSSDGGTLFVSFGSYYDGAIGWMVAVDVRGRRIASTFSGSPTVVSTGPANNRASGGMWASGGPALGSDGRVVMTTGNSPADALGAPGVWGNSVLAWNPDLTLAATYSPFNYCLMDEGDTDLGGSGPLVFDVDPSLTSTPHLVTFGGKQGVVYLADRDHLGGGLTGRPPCDPVAANDSPAADTSLFGPQARPQYTPPSPGPLPVFGPYSDVAGDNAVNHAKMRTSPAILRPADGSVYVYVSGTSRDPAHLDRSVPPSVARLRVVLAPGQRAYFDPEALTNTSVAFLNPGSPIVTSHDGGADAVVWVLDQNSTRTAAVIPKPGFDPPNAVLYAFDAMTLKTLWQSRPDDLGPSGKYGHVVVAHGRVFAVTDRVAAFGGGP